MAKQSRPKLRLTWGGRPLRFWPEKRIKVSDHESRLETQGTALRQKLEIAKAHYEAAAVDLRSQRKKLGGGGDNFAAGVEAFTSDPATFRDGSVRAQSLAGLEPISMRWQRLANGDPEALAAAQKRCRKARKEIRKDDEGCDMEAVEVCDPRVNAWLRKPDPDRDMPTLTHETRLHIDMDGRAYWLKLYLDAPNVADYTRRGAPDEAAFADALKLYFSKPPDRSKFTGMVSLMRPDEIHPGRLVGGRSITHFEWAAGASLYSSKQDAKNTLHRDRVVYFRDPHPLGVHDGLGWMEVASDDLKADNELEEWQTGYRDSGGIANALGYPEKVQLTGAQRDDILIAHGQAARRSDPDALVIVDKGGKYERMAADPKVTQTAEGREFHRREKRTASGVPPLLEGDPSETNYLNGEPQLETFFTIDIGPAASRMWAAVSMQLGPDFDVPGLFFIPETDKNRFLGADTEALEVARAAEIRTIQTAVSAGQLDPGSAVELLRMGHGFTEDEATALIENQAATPATRRIGDLVQIGGLLTQVAAGQMSRLAAARLLVREYGYEDETAALDLLADLGTSFVPTPAAPAGLFGADGEGADKPDPFDILELVAAELEAAHPQIRKYIPKRMRAVSKAYKAIIPEGAADRLDDPPPGYAKRTGARLEVCKQTVRGLARLEAVNTELWIDSLEGYFQRWNRELLRQLGTIPADFSPAQMNAALANLSEFDSELADILAPLHLDALQAAGGLVTDIAGGPAFELVAANRTAAFTRFTEFSELMNETGARAARRFMLGAQAEGATAAELARGVESMLTQINPARARLIVNVELGGALNEGIGAGVQFSGAHLEWVALPPADNRRQGHQSVDGQIVKPPDTFSVPNDSDGGVDTMRWPHDLSAPGEQLFNCGCTGAPSFPDR